MTLSPWCTLQNVIHTQKCEPCQTNIPTTPFPAGGFPPDNLIHTLEAQAWPQFMDHALDKNRWLHFSFHICTIALIICHMHAAVLVRKKLMKSGMEWVFGGRDVQFLMPTSWDYGFRPTRCNLLRHLHCLQRQLNSVFVAIKRCRKCDMVRFSKISVTSLEDEL